MSDINLDQPKKLFSGFLSNLNFVTSLLFTIVPTLITWFIYKDFKLMAIMLLSCLFIATICTVHKNNKANQNLIESLESELGKAKYDMDKLTNDLQVKNIKINSLEYSLNEVTGNRNTILEGFDNYKKEAILYKDAYNSAKSGIVVLSNMQNNKSIKSSIEILFTNIEKDILERNEINEGCI